MRSQEPEHPSPARAQLNWPIRVATWIFYYGLSLNLFIATLAVLKFLGVEYSIGYDVHVANATLFSSQLDPIVWLSVTLVTAVTALVLTAGSEVKQRFGWVSYALVALAEIGLYANGQAASAYWISLLFGLSFIITTTMPARQPMSTRKCCGVFMTLTGFLTLLGAVESVALISRVIGWFPKIAQSPILLNTQALQDELSGSLFNYSTILMLSAIFVWIPAVPLILRTPHHTTSHVREKQYEPNAGRLISLILLGVALAIAALVPLAPDVSSFQLRGIDARFYYQRLASASSLQDTIAQLYVEPREPYILLLYVVQRLTSWNALQVIAFGPALLGIVFAATAYILTKELTKDWITSGVAAFLSGTSVHTTVGLYAGIYANWLALPIALLFLYFFEKSLTKPSVAMISMTVFTSYLVAFLHPWTWAMMLIAVIVGLALMSHGLFGKRASGSAHFLRTRGPMLFLALSPLVILAVASMSGIFPGLRNAISLGLYGVMGSMTLTRLTSVFSILSFTLRAYVGSLLAYSPLLILATIGGVSIASSELRTGRLLVALLSATSISAVLLDSWFQWRVLYIIPFELLASVGILSTLSGVDRATKRYGPVSSRLILALKLILVAVILMDSLNYALRADVILPNAV